MSKLTLRPAESAAAHDRLAQLARDIWHEHYPGIIGVDQIEYMLEQGYSANALMMQQSAGTRFVLAYHDDTPVGFSAVTPDGDDAPVAWLDKLYIHAKARRGGVARSLLEHACTQARERGVDEMRLRVNRENAGAIDAYQRLGFTVTHEDIKDIGNGFVMDDYVMARKLAD